jgi:hypothetical protein
LRAARVLTHCSDEKALMDGAASAGAAVFECAGAKNMGVDPKKFVRDRYCRAPDVKNCLGGRSGLSVEGKQ